MWQGGRLNLNAVAAKKHKFEGFAETQKQF